MTATRPAPLYQQTAQRIAAEVTVGLPPGSRLPSERKLCDQFGVSRVTLRAALAMLADHGAITSSAARGWFVLLAPRAPSATAMPLLGFTETARNQGQSTSARVLRAVIRPASLDEAEAFGNVAGAAIFELRRLRFINGLVIAIDNSRVPVAICPGIESHDFTHESLYRVLRTATEPIVAQVADYAVEAVAPTGEEAELLELPATMPLLLASQRTRDQDGRTFELGSTRYRGDRFRFRASLGTRTS